MSKKNQILLFALNLILFSHFLCGDIIGQEKPSVTFEKVSTIKGDDENFIRSPIEIFAHNDLVYIADMSDMKIKVFKVNGEFVRSFGNRGRGPGEFQHFTKLWLNQDNNLVVVDFFNSKMAFFNTTGEYISEEKLDIRKIQWPRHFEIVNEEQTLVKYSIKPDSKKVFHIWDKNFTSIDYEFSLPEDLEYDETLKNMLLGINVGGYSSIHNEKLFHAPYFYEGKIYTTELSKENTPRIWTALEGYATKGASYRELRTNEALQNDDQERIYDYQINTSGQKRISFRLNNGTNGLFTTNNGRIAHLFEITDGDQKRQGVQVFSSTGKVFGHTFYNSKTIRDDLYTLIKDYPKTMDEKNRVYSFNYQGEDPVINVYQLSVN
ncbi:MAG: 6-bladed beta-propeller [Balneola sp.]